MRSRLLLLLTAAALLGGCSREIEHDLRITDVETGWYDESAPGTGMQKIVPGLSIRLHNVSDRAISSVQIMAIFRHVGDTEWRQEALLRGIDRDGLEPGATGAPLLIQSPTGYTGEEPVSVMLSHSQFVDVAVDLLGKHGSRNWVKLGEYPIERVLRRK